MAAQNVKPKAATTKKSPVVKKAAKAAPIPSKHQHNELKKGVIGWLRDASVEVPAYPGAEFQPGQRELEFSVGFHQHEEDDLMRSDLRGRALIHAQGMVLALVEASFVTVMPKADVTPALPQQMYGELRGHLERLLEQAGHVPPLPESLEKVA